MDIEFLQNHISKSVKLEKKFLFLFDTSKILYNFTELTIKEIILPVYYYENDLQFRAELEWAKDEYDETVFCVIIRKEKGEIPEIADFLVRGELLEISPQMLLNSTGTKQWSDVVNWLTGNDFWQFLKSIRRLENRSDLALAVPEEALIASALLNIDFTKSFDAASAFIFYFRKMQTNRFLQFKSNYPRLAKFIEKKLFSDVPELEQIFESKELMAEFWLGNTETGIKNPGYYERNYDLKYQMAIKAPLFVRDQIAEFEKNYFKSNAQVQKHLKQQLISDSWDSWLAYIQKEQFLVQPLTVVLEKAVGYLIKNYQYVAWSDVERLKQVLDEHQLMRSQKKTPNEIRHPLSFLFQLTKSVIRIYELLKQIETGISGDNFDIPLLISQIYPNMLTELPTLFSEANFLHERHKLLTKALIQKVGNDIERIRFKCHSLFVDWIEKKYKGKTGFFTTALENGFYPFQLIRQYQEAHSNEPVYIFIFDGMRWDGWNVLQPLVAKAFNGRKIEIQPVLTPLPTLTPVCRSFLLTGEFAAGDERQHLQDVYPDLNPEIYFYRHSEAAHIFSERPEAGPALKIIHVDIFDNRIHHARLGLKMLYREIMEEFEENILPLFGQIPRQAKIIMLADHGFIQVTGKWFAQLESRFDSAQPPQNRRFLTLNEQAADKKNFIFFSNHTLGQGHQETEGLAFLRESIVFKIMPSESYTRYAHGGISLEEMVVPVVWIS